MNRNLAHAVASVGLATMFVGVTVALAPAANAAAAPSSFSSSFAESATCQPGNPGPYPDTMPGANTAYCPAPPPPPVTNPPVVNPPVKPPVVIPPVKPPVVIPPAVKPPVTNPPVAKPPAVLPPAAAEVPTEVPVVAPAPAAVVVPAEPVEDGQHNHTLAMQPVCLPAAATPLVTESGFPWILLVLAGLVAAGGALRAYAATGHRWNSKVRRVLAGPDHTRILDAPAPAETTTV